MTTVSAPVTRPNVWDEFGNWVEGRSEQCRSGRILHTVVNHRTNVAIEFGDDELDGEGQPRPGLRAELEESGFLAHRPPDAAATRLSIGPRLSRFVRTLDISFPNADTFVRRVHRRGAHLAFRPGVVVAQVLVGLAGVVAAFIVMTSGPSVELAVDAELVPVFLALGILAIAVHELAHAVVVTHHGRSVDGIGFNMHLATPTFYVESVDALLLTRRQRMIQAAAGPWAEWLLTSVFFVALVVLPIPDGVEAVLHRFAVLNLVNVVSNLLPFVGLDGSLLLADAVRVPDLTRRSRGAVGRLASRLFARERVTAAHCGLAGYAVANAIVAIGLVALSVYLWIVMFSDLIATLYGQGAVGIAVLVAAGYLLSRPALAVVVPRVVEAADTAGRLAHDVRFKRSIRWRVAATERLCRVDAQVAALTTEQLGHVAGLLSPVRRRDVLDPDEWAVVEVRTGSRFERSIRAAVHRDHIAEAPPAHRRQLASDGCVLPRSRRACTATPEAA
jgi:hypothetical protein